MNPLQCPPTSSVESELQQSLSPEGLPAVWSVVSLRDLATAGIVSLQNGFPCGKHNDIGLGIPHLRPMNVSDGGQVVLDTLKYVVPEQDVARYLIRPGDVIFNNTNSEELVGKTAYWDRNGNFVLSNHVTIIRVLNTEKLDSFYLSRLLHKLWFDGFYFRICRRHVNQASVSLERLKQVVIPLPPIHEQRRIARVLSTIQRAIEAQDKVIAAARELKRSLMKHLFTYGPVPVAEAPRVPLKETEIGRAPEHWQILALGDFSAIGNGSTPKRTNPSYWQGGSIPWLTSAKVHESIILGADELVTELARAECHLPIVRKRSIVVAITGQGKTLGNAAMVTFDTCVSQHLAYVSIKNEGVVPEFVLVFLQHRYEDLRRLSQGGGTTKGALTCALLKRYLVTVPPLGEQELIWKAIWAINQKVDAEEKSKAALQALFKSMLHHLMTGKIRVPAEPMGDAAQGVAATLTES